jgi:hypothetical protein
MRADYFFRLRWNKGRTGASIVNVSVRKAFFFEKKNQKTFVASLAARSGLSTKRAAAQKIKVFLLLFLQKKKNLSYFI